MSFQILILKFEHNHDMWYICIYTVHIVPSSFHEMHNTVEAALYHVTITTFNQSYVVIEYNYL